MNEVNAANWREKLRVQIVNKGLRLTQQRLLICEIFFEELTEHANIDELYQKVKTRNDGVGYATVYRTLKLLTECGLATSIQIGDGTTRFEPVSDHHDHLICTECGKIVEFENDEIERLQEEVAIELGFTLTSHSMELYGVCSDPKCQAKQRAN